MAGNVSVGLRGGLLSLSGDPLDNQLKISQPAPGMILVEGIEGTTVNGQEFVNVTGSLRHVTILLRQGGEDQLAIHGPVSIPGNLRASLGAGELAIEGTAGPVEIGRDLTIKAGANGNVTILNEVFVDGETDIKVGGTIIAVSGLATVPDFEAATFSDSLTIDNPYFPVIPGGTWTYEAEGIDDETGEAFSETIIVEVLSATRTIQGVQVRTVRDRVFVEGVLIEDTFDWYAQDDDGNVWYLGEDVTNYEFDDAGNVVGTNNDGSWVAGEDDAQPGTIMQADPTIGDRYYQEFQPGGVLDQAEVLSTDETLTVQFGTFTNVLRTKDGSVREPFGLDHKVYALGLGLLGEVKFDSEDNEIEQTNRLVSVTLNGVAVRQLVSPVGFMGTNASGEAKEGIEFGDELEIRAAGPIVLNGTELEDEVEIHSNAEVLIIDSIFRDSSWISATEAVTFRNVSADRAIKIRSDGDVYIFDSNLDELRIRFGRSDNNLVVEGSDFGWLIADGGSGDDTFEDRGGNTFRRIRLTQF
jgi:hypothetical protein